MIEPLTYTQWRVRQRKAFEYYQRELDEACTYAPDHWDSRWQGIERSNLGAVITNFYRQLPKRKEAR